jgi:hypothetical protein
MGENTIEATQIFDTTGLEEDEILEMKSQCYDTEAYIDLAIKRVKKYDTEIERFEKMLKEEIELLTYQTQQKIDKIQKKKSWDEFNLGNIIRNAPDKKENKTQWKKSYISGDIIIKKSDEKLNKPKIEDNILKTDDRLTDFIKTKEVKDLDWETLKPKLIIKDHKVINTETGEELTDIIPVTPVPEKVIIK